MPVIVSAGGGAGGGGGGGDSTYTDTYANIPAPSNDGDLFLPSDGVEIYRDTGAAWAGWGPMFPLTEPPSAGWSWVNQGTAVVDSTQGGIFLYDNTVSAGDDYSCRVRAAPAAPYTITMCILGMPGAVTGKYSSFGPLWRQSSDGKLVTVEHRGGQQGYLLTKKMNSPTSGNSDYFSYAWDKSGSFFPRFCRIADDGSNRIFSISADGIWFSTMWSVGRTDFITPDEVGFYINTVTSITVAMRLIHWREA